jgi:hypothetical protein
MSSLVFAPDAVADGPCPHLVLLEVELGWLGQTDWGDSRESSFRHPALASADPGFALNRLLWWGLRGRPGGVFAPATSFLHRHRDAEGMALDPRGGAA